VYGCASRHGALFVERGAHQLWKGKAMQILKLGVAPLVLVGIILGVSVSPTAAFELPDVQALPGESYPKLLATGRGTLENAGTVVASLETVLGESVTATAMEIEVWNASLTASDAYILTLAGVKEPRTKTACKSPDGIKEGVVLIFDGEYHVVTNAGLTPMLLLLFPELTIECNSGKLKLKVKAPLMLKLEKITSGIDVTEYGLVANCTAKGKQELTEYVNDEGKTVIKSFLVADFGLGFEQACERTTKELVVKTSKMLDFLF
jgi:hypothetical protein